MRLPVLLIALAALTAGCAAETVPGDPGLFRTPAPLTAPASQVVFQVAVGGGMTPADSVGNHRPALTIYGDGTAYVIAPDEQTSTTRPIALQRGRVPRSTLHELVTLAGRTDLFEDTDFGEPSITDSPTTSLTFRPGRAGARRASAYALSMSGTENSLTPVQRANRARLSSMLDRLFDGVRGRAAWAPRRIELTQPYQDDDDRALPWPGPPIAGVLSRTVGPGRGCGVVSGAPARTIYTAARTNSTTRWSDGRTVTNLVILVLLPGEPGCSR